MTQDEHRHRVERFLRDYDAETKRLARELDRRRALMRSLRALLKFRKSSIESANQAREAEMDRLASLEIDNGRAHQFMDDMGLAR